MDRNEFIGKIPRNRNSMPMEPLHFPDPSAPAKVNVWSVDRNYRYTFFNENHRADMKAMWDADISLGKSLIDFIDNEEYRGKVKENYDIALDGAPHRSIDKFTFPDGSERYYENFGNPIFDEENRVTGVMLYTVDVTQRMKLEQKLRSNIALLQSIVGSPESVIIYSVDTDYRYIFFNNAHREAMKKVWQTEPKLGERLDACIPDKDYLSRRKGVYEQAFEGKMFSDVSEFTDIQGKTRYFENISEPVKNPEGEIIGVTVFVLEITQRVEAENRLRESLEEKEVLLKEIHHRVKNDIQLITSMLNLQLDLISDEKARRALENSQTRLNTMAFIHKALSRGESLGQVDMQEYVEPLIESIREFYSHPNKCIEVRSDMVGIHLDTDRAIPVGLIINELLTNSLKYAFSERDSGLIRLSLSKTGEGTHHLQVRDDGIGFPPGFDIEKSESLGTRLISALAEQLGGSLQITSGPGTKVDIYF